MTKSTRLLIFGLVLFGIGAAVFFSVAPSVMTVSSGDDPAAAATWLRPVAGVVSGLGIVVFVIGFVQRVLGR